MVIAGALVLEQLPPEFPTVPASAIEKVSVAPGLMPEPSFSPCEVSPEWVGGLKALAYTLAFEQVPAGS